MNSMYLAGATNSVVHSAIWQSSHLQHVQGLGKAGGVSPYGSNVSNTAGIPQANYDEQLGISFSQDFTSLQYNVTAVEQSDSYGYGPAYLLNGLSDKSYWYQIGLSWHWPFLAGGYVGSFSMNYEVFNSTGQSIFPSKGGGLIGYSGPVNQGDSVLLSLYFSGGQVIMYSKDWNTGATARESYTSQGATSFVGLPGHASNSNGFFTGLMTEQYHVSPYYGSESKVTYSNPHSTLSSAVMWIDEYNVNTSQVLFGQASSELYYTNPSQFQTFSSNGALEASNAYEFITGSTSLIGITLSYSIQGGGSLYSPPQLTYFSNGAQETTTLSLQPTTYYMDNGSMWSIANPLSGSTVDERWITAQPSQALVTSSQTINLVYVHQYLVTIEPNPSGGGTTTPSGTNWYVALSSISISAQANSPDFFAGWNASAGFISFTSVKSSSTNATILGPGTIYANFAQILVSLSAGSGEVTQGASQSLVATVVGATGSASLSVSGLPQGTSAHFESTQVPLATTGAIDALNISASLSTPPGTYPIDVTVSSALGSSSTEFELTIREAIPLTLGFSLRGAGATSSEPVLNYTYNGVSKVESLGNVQGVFYVDYGSTWYVGAILPGSTSSERWISNQTASGNATTPLNMTFVYFHQYYVTFDFQSLDGAAPPQTPSVTFRSFGSPSSANVSASGSKMWVDAGSPYSYTAVINGSSVSERWDLETTQGSGNVTGSVTLNPVYYHQYLVAVRFQVVGGGSGFAPPEFNFQSGGLATSTTLNSQQSKELWIDSASKWTATALLNSSSSSSLERWIDLNATNTTGTIKSPGQMLFSYQHQYFVAVSQNVRSGGLIQPLSGWFNAGQVVTISARASPGWEFSKWDGTASSNSTSSSITFSVNGPANETAEFYAGLTISAGANGELSYSYGSTTGQLSAGSSETIYVPPGTSVSFEATPSSSFLYAVSGWNVENVSAGASPSYSLVVSSPTTVEASFSYNYTVLATVFVVLALLAGMSGVLVRRRHERNL